MPIYTDGWGTSILQQKAMAQQQASGLGGNIGQSVRQAEHYHAYIAMRAARGSLHVHNDTTTYSCGSKTKPKTLRAELQAETDKWLKDVL